VISDLSVTLLILAMSAGGATPFTPPEKLLDAIEIKESSGRGAATPDGDDGAAIGSFQIHRAYWTDAMKALGKNWPYSDARIPWKARAATRAYIRHYARAARRPDLEAMARIHNGGPVGYRKPVTVQYWREVRAIMKRGNSAVTQLQPDAPGT